MVPSAPPRQRQAARAATQPAPAAAPQTPEEQQRATDDEARARSLLGEFMSRRDIDGTLEVARSMALPAPSEDVITWAALAEFDGNEARGRVLELRVVAKEVFGRLVFSGRDHDGSTLRVAAYTSSRALPGLEVGRIFRWTHPRYHEFTDGSTGARIEDGDLPNVTLGCPPPQ